jgi:hypothetical protein
MKLIGAGIRPAAAYQEFINIKVPTRLSVKQYLFFTLGKKYNYILAIHTLGTIG